jgi:hypothetical protein
MASRMSSIPRPQVITQSDPRLAHRSSLGDREGPVPWSSSYPLSRVSMTLAASYKSVRPRLSSTDRSHINWPIPGIVISQAAGRRSSHQRAARLAPIKSWAERVKHWPTPGCGQQVVNAAIKIVKRHRPFWIGVRSWKHDVANVAPGRPGARSRVWVGSAEVRGEANWTCPTFVESVFDLTLLALRTEVG